MKSKTLKQVILTNSIAEHAAAMARGEYSAVDLTRACLEQIRLREPEVGAFLTLDAERALREAEASDARRRAGSCRGILDGIPYAVKDNFCTKGMKTTAASRMLAEYIPTYDATVVTRLGEAGCVLLGKLNLDEFAMGSTCEYSALGRTRNPHARNRVAGGSSGGSAAAVAALEVPFSLGSDTGGSVRQPAAFCGTVGLKPTYGAISRYGLIAMASSLDCVGILSRSVADSALVLQALLGYDPADATSLEHPDPDPTRLLEQPVEGLRVALVSALLEGNEISPEVAAATRLAADALRRRGAVVQEIDLPSPDWALASYCVLSAAEASSNLARYDGVRFGHRASGAADLVELYDRSRAEGFGNEVKCRILFGGLMLSEENRARYYEKALAARRLITARLRESFASYDLILTPTSPTAAFFAESKLPTNLKRRADLCAVYASLGGFPAITIPYGRDRDGMPLAVQLTANTYEEAKLLQVAALLERDSL